jgi:hypothetical protein
MRVSSFLFFISIAGLLSIAQSAKSEDVSQNPAGRWESVDYVQNINDFNPERKNWQGELFFKQVEFRLNGTTDSFFRWQNGLILHNDGKTKAQFYIKQINGQMYLFLPWLNGDVTDRGQKPWYYVLKKVTGTVKPQDAPMLPTESGGLAEQGAYGPIEYVNFVKEYDDVRDKNLSRLSPAKVADVITTLKFNNYTIWPKKALPPYKQPEKLLLDAMNPGLEVRKLHKQGITGKGVNVAIIDQAMYLEHPEFAGKIAAYHDLASGEKGSMHGPSVASLLAGKNCGTAPDVRVYYAATRGGVYEVDYAEGLDWIIEQNSKLPPSEKIRVVSVSAAPGQSGTHAGSGQKTWDAALQRAQQQGILVLDCTDYHGFIQRCFLDPANRENPSQCSSDMRPGQKFDSKNDMLFAPSGPRTMAEQYQINRFTYQYNSKGGQSWAVPYAAGVLAMGWQVNPELQPGQMKDLLFKSAAAGQNGEKIINPQRFIAMVKTAKPGVVGPITDSARPGRSSR